jgi:hypothetical protein
LGKSLYVLGYSASAEGIEVREGFVEIRCSAGAARLPVVDARIFSHLMAKSSEEIERLVNVGMPPV